MYRIFQKLIFKKFVLLVGDEGAQLTLFERNIVKKSFSVSSLEDKNIREFSKLLALNSSVPVYILVDTSEQSFKLCNFPSTNRMILKKLLIKRISRDYKKQDLHNYYDFNFKDSKEKNVSHFVVANIANISPLKEWLEYSNNITNPIDAIYSLPIELSGLLDEMHNELKAQGTSLKKSRWKILVMQATNGGIRVIVNEDSRLIFSRLINFNAKNYEDSEVETLKNQVLGTIEYLRRIGFKDKHGMNVFMLLSDDLSNKFNTSLIKGYNFYNFPHASLNKITNLKANHTNDLIAIDEFSSRYFIQKGRYFGFLTQNLEKISSMNNLSIILNFISVVSFVLLCSIVAYNINLISATKKSISYLEDNNAKLNQILENTRAEKFGFDIDEDKVIDVARLHSILEQDQSNDPLLIITKLAVIKPKIVLIKSYDWRLIKNNQISIKIDAIFISEGLSYEDLFSKYDIFIRDIKTELNNYEIQHSELPDTINFSSKLDDIPITINITGPIR